MYLPLSTIFLLDFGTIPTVWYFLFSTLSQTRLTRNFGKVEIFLKSRFKLSACQLNLLLLSQISMCRNFGFLEIIF